MTTEPLAIVRELAERGPFVDDEVFCADCGVSPCRDDEDVQPGSLRDLNDPANHETSCLWRRAKALYPGATP